MEAVQKVKSRLLINWLSRNTGEGNTGLPPPPPGIMRESESSGEEED
jgi:hypothetical protein